LRVPGTAPSPPSTSAPKKVVASFQAIARGANRLKFKPDGTKAFISAGAELIVFNLATQKELKRIRIGRAGGGGVLIQLDGDGFVVVVDLKTLEVVAKIEAGGNPDGLAWAVQPLLTV
jgi:YVTN family beta-propeller protein